MKVFVYSVTLLIMVNIVISLNEAFISAEAPFRHLDCPSVDDVLHPVQMPHPDNCSKYYSCQKGVAYPMSCPDQLHWSMLTYRCDYPAVAKCNSSAAPQLNPITELPATPTYTTNKPPLSEEASFYQNYAGDCNRFYQCQVMRCPHNLHWNTQMKRCDFPHMAACELAPLFSTLSTSTTTEPITYSPINRPIDPTMFTTLAGAEFVPTAATPPPTTVPTITLTTMISDSGNGTNTAEEDQHNLNKLCSANTQHSSYLHYPGDCQKFIQCNGIAFVHTCPANLFWNAELITCDRYCK